MKIGLARFNLLWLLAAIFTLYSVPALANVDNIGVFDKVLAHYQAASNTWAKTIITHASWLFWTLVLISMVWTFSLMALRKADIMEFFSELLRFTIFTGFFWWLLTNGPDFAKSIIDSLRQVAGEATGLGKALTPSGIVDIGFDIFFKALDHTSVWSPVDSLVGILLSLAILVLLALVGVNMLLLLTSAWILMYSGIFFLGFGGSRWTSDIAINYYRTVLGVAASLFAMTLLVGVGTSFIDIYYSNMSGGISFKELSVLLIVAIVIYYLVNKVPPLIAGIVGNGASGIGTFGAGAVMGAAGMATAAAAAGGAVLTSGVQSMGGGIQAVRAAFESAQHHMNSGSGLFSTNHNSTAPKASSGLSGVMDTGSRLLADTGVNLAKGMGSVMKDKTSNMAQSFNNAASGTTGGKVASSIKSSTPSSTSNSAFQQAAKESPVFSNNGLGAADVSEIEAFVNKVKD